MKKMACGSGYSGFSDMVCSYHDAASYSPCAGGGNHRLCRGPAAQRPSVIKAQKTTLGDATVLKARQTALARSWVGSPELLQPVAAQTRSPAFIAGHIAARERTAIPFFLARARFFVTRQREFPEMKGVFDESPYHCPSRAVYSHAQRPGSCRRQSCNRSDQSPIFRRFK